MTTRRSFRWTALLFTALIFVPASGHAQSIGERLKAKAKERVDAKVESAMDKALDKIESAAKCVAGDEECVKEAGKSGKGVVLTDSDGKILPPDQQPKGSPAKNADAVAAANANGGGAGSKTVSGAWANFDFVPGERILFTDDFSRDRVGNFPQRLEMMTGNMEIVDAKGARYLRATSNSRFAVNLPEVLPARFTMEFDLTMPWWGLLVYAGPQGAISNEPMDESWHTKNVIKISGTTSGVWGPDGTVKSLVDPRGVTGADPITGHLFRVRVHGDGNYIKVYLDEHRIANVPNANFNRTRRIVFDIAGGAEAEGDNTPVLIGNISINAGGRDMYDALSADGRVVTQGIFFDVGSDRIRAESTPTLKQIGDMLKDHADLKLMIEGHTDNTGTAASNQALSEKRAAAIVAYLTSTFKIDAARLKSAGLGASKPAAPNTTPEGRQQNRRVELVKM